MGSSVVDVTFVSGAEVSPARWRTLLPFRYRCYDHDCVSSHFCHMIAKQTVAEYRELPY